MARFIWLTERQVNRNIYVNVDRICKFYTSVSDKDHKSYTTIILDSGTYDAIKVKESIGEIFSLIDEHEEKL